VGISISKTYDNSKWVIPGRWSGYDRAKQCCVVGLIEVKEEIFRMGAASKRASGLAWKSKEVVERVNGSEYLKDEVFRIKEATASLRTKPRHTCPFPFGKTGLV
jgi:hypothetical protein